MTIQTAIVDRLAADATLTTTLGFGFISNRWLKRDGEGATPLAFDPANGGRMKRCVVVLDGGEFAHPSPRPGHKWRLWDSFPTTHIFGEAHATGKVAVEAAALRIEALLAWPFYAFVNGQFVTFEPDHRLTINDSQAFPGAVVMVATWRATAARRIIAA